MLIRLTPVISNKKDDKTTIIVSNISYVRNNSSGGSTITCVSGIIDVKETEEEIYSLLEELKFK